MAGMRALDKSSGQTATYDGTAWMVGTVKGVEAGAGGIAGGRRTRRGGGQSGGGTVVDVEARAAIVAMLDRMRTHGLIAP